MSLDPVATSADLSQRYISYIKTTFFIRNDMIREKFEKALSSEKFAKGPILEVTPPFRTGSTVEALIAEGVLSPEFRELGQGTIPSRLYTHQERAIRRIVTEERNIIAATGTGSGKTEIYLVPILNALMREKERGTPCPGVRALLLYPMNALVNDQLKRMRTLLARYPAITFGRYTGETEEEHERAREIYIKENEAEPLPNELISREEMRNTPPHILLTNYAMLEYLLLRPADIDLFEGKHAGRWTFVVLDEIHTYTGAKGIEMAMLLRRLKQRVLPGTGRRIRCIGTSATLAHGEEDIPGIVRFARNIFGEMFEIEDIILGERVSPAAPEETISLSPRLFFRWAAALEEGRVPDIAFFRNSLPDEGIPLGLVDRWEKDSNGSPRTFLFHVLRHDSSILALQQYLEKNETPYLENVVAHIFPGNPDGERLVKALVTLAIWAKPGDSDYPLIPARYHFFIRALEGAFLALTPNPLVTLEPLREIRAGNGTFKVFEMGVCRNCGAVYLVGNREDDCLSHPHPVFYDYSPAEYYLIGDDFTPWESDDEEMGPSPSGGECRGEPYRLCVKCGKIQSASILKDFCTCDPTNTFKVYKANTGNSGVHTCLACHQTTSVGSIVHRVVAGSDAMGSVLATELFHHIPLRTVKVESSPRTNDSEWSVTVSHGKKEDSVTKKARKLLVFSDSRQDAAFFAPYLNRTYHQVQMRALLLSTVRKYSEQINLNQWNLNDFVRPVLNELKAHSVCDASRSDQEIENIAWKWLLHEFFSFEQRLSLEQLGLLCFVPKKPGIFAGVRALQKDPWNLSSDEVWTLLAILLNTLRKERIFQFPTTVLPDDEFFAPYNAASYIRLDSPLRNPRIIAWLPRENRINRRLDFILRLAGRLGIVSGGFEKREARMVLEKIWDAVLAPHNPGSCFARYFTGLNLGKNGITYQLVTSQWVTDSRILNGRMEWFECDTCHRITPHNLRGVCPTFRCPGTLRVVNPQERFSENHYFQLYTRLEPRRFVAEEHTAQLKKSYARTLQTNFINGDIDILCCSTTFELGVDVGELESVLLRNVPPTPANYIQRAGRAGRRTSSTAYCLTLCQARSHDFHYFLEPEKMVRGRISPPSFDIGNEKIVRRHLIALALSAFWRQPEYRSLFGTVGDFFFREGSSGPDLLRTFLRQKPGKILEACRKVIPESLLFLLDDVNGEWRFVAEVFDPVDGPFSRATREIHSDIRSLDSLYQERIRQGKKTDYILNIRNMLLSRRIIDYLASRNVLPKYGFPVDVVELAVYSPEGRNLDLTRDMEIALSEYAPGSEVVAAGKVWKSRYVKRLVHAEMDLEQKYYVICRECNWYKTSFEEDLPEVCEACESPLGSARRLIKPGFGFVVDNRGPGKPRERRPEKTYSTRVFYTGESQERLTIPLPLPDGRTRLIATSAENARFGVLNFGKNRSGFKICSACGYTVLGTDDVPRSHETAFHQTCRGGTFERFDLAHEYMTDMVKIVLDNYDPTIPKQEGLGFWQSLLYGLLDATSSCLDIDRNDIDGCIYFEKGRRTALVLFDAVPGGAGHVKRLVEEDGRIIKVLEETLKNLSRCDCGGEEGEASCYGCLRNYENQYCHPNLKRGPVVRFLRRCLSPGK